MDVSSSSSAAKGAASELSLEPDVHGASTNAPEAEAVLPEPQTTVAADNQAKAGVVS